MLLQRHRLRQRGFWKYGKSRGHALVTELNCIDNEMSIPIRYNEVIDMFGVSDNLLELEVCHESKRKSIPNLFAFFMHACDL